MQLTMNLMIAGVIPLLLALHCKLMSGKPVLMKKRSLMCHSSSQCNHHVYGQIRHQVADLNKQASALLNVYLEHQGYPFNDKQNLNDICPINASFPSVHQTCNKKEILIDLYKIFVFFNASLGNITRDQNNFNPAVAQLIQALNNTSNAVRGLLSNLTCLLCSEYNVSHVDVTYGNSSDWNKKLQSKKQGCQVLRWYEGVVSEAASNFKECHKPV
ncbi:leukemia inhibitory factor isoform X2 [Paroedura picta]